MHSSSAVSIAVPPLSSGISQPTHRTTYAPFTPSKSEQRSPPLYYRGCWHRVSRGFLFRYHHFLPVLMADSLFPDDRSLRPEGLHPPRRVALSHFRALQKILDCSLPWESGQCLSPSVADHPLRPATRKSLGEPLPHQLADGTRAPP